MTESRSHASFDAPQFATEGCDEGLPMGRDLAAALAEGLGRRGYKCEVPDPYEEFAWQVDVDRDGKTWLLTAGHFGDPDLGAWLVFAETVGAGGGGIFRKRPPRFSIGEMTGDLHAVLTEDFGAAPRWFTRTEWEAGPQVEGAERP